MRIFGDDKYSGRRRDKYSGGGNRSDRPQMYDAVCDKCGRDCKVPFRPSGDKPIYCSECFEKQGGGNSDRGGRRDYGDRGGRREYGNNRSNYRSDNRDREMFTAICDDCGKECEVPFKPSSDKPIYCSDCFEKRGSGKDKGGSGGNSKQLEEVNEKLERILNILEGKGEAKEEVKEKVKKAAKKKVKKIEIKDEDDDIEEVKEEEKVDLDKVINEEIEEEKEKTMDVVEDMIEE